MSPIRALLGPETGRFAFMAALVAVALLWNTPSKAQTTDPSLGFFNNGFGDFSEELENAKSEGKQGVLIMFEMDECPFCHRMKTTVLSDPKVQEYFKNHFLIFSVDIEGDVEITDFTGVAMSQKDFALKSYRVRATPVFAFFDLEGKLITKYTGATRDADEFLRLGNYVVEGHYKETTFQQYKREPRGAASQ